MEKSIYAVQCQSAMSLHVVVNKFLEKNGGKPLPVLTTENAPDVPEYTISGSVSAISDFLKSSREEEINAGSDIGEDKAQESVTGDVTEMKWETIVYHSKPWM